METANASSKRSLEAKAAGTKSSTVCGRELCQVSSQCLRARRRRGMRWGTFERRPRTLERALERIALRSTPVCQVLTPGTLTDEELLGTPAAVYTLSVCEDEGSGTIGAARTAHSLRGVRRRASRAPRVAADE